MATFLTPQPPHSAPSLTSLFDVLNHQGSVNPLVNLPCASCSAGHSNEVPGGECTCPLATHCCSQLSCPQTSAGGSWCYSPTECPRNSFLELPFGGRGKQGNTTEKLSRSLRPNLPLMRYHLEFRILQYKAKQLDQSSLTTLKELTLRSDKTL